MALDTSFRTWPAADLAALRVSLLTQIKNIEGTGQSHALNGRNTTQADIGKLTEQLANVNAAIAWQSTAANQGNKGFARRFSSFNPCGQ